MPVGKVYFVGAGPGSLDLVTRKAEAIIRSADLILYTDSLVNPAITDWAKPGAEVLGSASLTHDEIVEAMVRVARVGGSVARVHTGDPSLYGAVYEQARRLAEMGIPYEIVPGVSSVFAAAAALGAELTVPELAQTVILTRVEGRTPMPPGERLRDLAAHRTTLCLFLSVGMIDRVVEELRAGGYPDDTPVAVVYRVTWPEERVVRGTLADIAQRVREARIRSHALILVGEVFGSGLHARVEGRSRLYDASFSHRYRRAAGKPDGLGAGGPAPRSRGRVAVLSITRHGTALAARLAAALPEADHWVPPKFAALAPGARVFEDPVSQRMGDLFRRYDGIVAFVSLGAVVRMVAPHLRDKKTDPGVVVVDDRGTFAIAVLSGHLGGANALARRVARVLGATPVVTTASDVRETVAVDLLGHEFGWRIEGWENVTAASAAVVNGEPVAVYQDAGEPDWWPPDRPLPENIRRVASLEEAAAPEYAAALVITDRVLGPEHASLLGKAVVYRPQSLVVGIGCNRGTPAEEIAGAVAAVLAGAGLSPLSVRNLASIDRKQDEPGLLAYAAAQGLRIDFYDAEALNSVEVPSPSEAPMRYVGARGVAEPAAVLSAGGPLVVPKVKSGNCTVAVARVQPRVQPGGGGA
ncbi:precorrin-4 C(11)-methyltransferase [Caldinitratiruptor microaerophilus]|uniref:Precorrin-4 C(11)-methyltransferase n=1 Tax=Caldinitratiruptor microaerophilus TaxID=671077 RepID=A0AA35CPF7_9FIRM|nr:precorrin-4 C(11)-methyltransferase [Caldinitratiruptor microaerophilus]BDG61557.1 hypothetical protein caldi_26470 [Caldinitratiruptor microaerophilus]